MSYIFVYFIKFISFIKFFFDNLLHNRKIELPAPPIPKLDKKMTKFIFIFELKVNLMIPN